MRQQLLDWLREWFRQHDYSPSIREIANGTGIKGGTLQRRLTKLKEEGYIDWEPGRNRTIRTLLPVEQQANPPENLKLLDAPGIPVIDTIAAGQLGQSIGDGESLDLSYLSNQPGKQFDYFAIRVVGDSMIGDNIFEGDFAIMQRVKELSDYKIQEGAIVAVRVEDEGTTLKRLYRKGKEIWLEASNRKYKTIVVPEDRVQIQGVLEGIWREAPRPSRRGSR